MTIIDASGANSGGAARFRREAERWVASQPTGSVRLIGIGRRVTVRWLVERESVGWYERRVAANNVSFIGGSAGRIVLLRNPLHFLRPGEHVPAVPRRVRYQTPIIRWAAHRADVLVVPSSDMADRVRSVLPRLSDRLIVRHHPLVGTQRQHRSHEGPYVLYPSIPSAHKDLRLGITNLVGAVERGNEGAVIKVTASPGDLGDLANHPRVEPIGRQSLAAMDELWADAAAVVRSVHR